MIRVEITAHDCVAGGVHGVVLKLRQAGIPVRVGPNNEVRPCPVWNAAGTRLIGKGRFTITQDRARNSVVYEYEPQIDSFEANVIDVEARVVQDAPRLDSKLQPE
jgi:hypothetical protein